MYNLTILTSYGHVTVDYCSIIHITINLKK